MRVLAKINTLGAFLWCALCFMYDRKSKNYNFTIDYMKLVEIITRIPNDGRHNKLWRRDNKSWRL